MIHDRTPIPLKDFLKDTEEYVEEVTSGEETLLLETESGDILELRHVKKPQPDAGKREGLLASHIYDAVHGVYRTRMTPEESYAHLMSFVGTWSDLDADAFLKEMYESRDVPGREFDLS